MRYVVFMAEWQGDHHPTMDEVKRLTFGPRNGLLINKKLLGMSTMAFQGTVRLCIHIHPAREVKLVEEALVKAFDPQGLKVIGTKSKLRDGNRLWDSLVNEEKTMYLILEAGYLGSLPGSFTYLRDEFTVFGNVKPLPDFFF